MFDAQNVWSPMFSTDNTIATFQLPFAFPIDITQIATSITTSNNEGGSSSSLSKRDASDFAVLNVPQVPAKTDVVSRNILLTFSNVPFASTSNSLFSTFLLDTTQGTSMNLGLHGTASSKYFLSSVLLRGLELILRELNSLFYSRYINCYRKPEPGQHPFRSPVTFAGSSRTQC